MKIVSKPLAYSANEDQVGISKFMIEYEQAPDTNSDKDKYQHLRIETDYACITDNPFYFNLSIPDGEHWSIDGVDDIKIILEDFKNRLYESKNSSK